jgi:hypothetical protein
MASDPSVLIDVDVPEPLAYGKAFDVRIRYRSSGETRVDVAIAGMLVIAPEIVSIDPAENVATGSFTIVDRSGANQPSLIHFIFTLGASHQHRLRNIA